MRGVRRRAYAFRGRFQEFSDIIRNLKGEVSLAPEPAGRSWWKRTANDVTKDLFSFLFPFTILVLVFCLR